MVGVCRPSRGRQGDRVASRPPDTLPRAPAATGTGPGREERAALHTVKNLSGYELHATDGGIGHVGDLLLDERTWSVRWVMVDTGGWLSGREVLIPPAAIAAIDHPGRCVDVRLTREQVEGSPDIALDRPVSRQHEETLGAHYGVPVPLTSASSWGVAGPEALLGDPSEAEALASDGQPEGDPHLRSAQEIIGYHVQATDHAIGHVEDLVVDDGAWAVRYVVVDTSNWLGGRKVLISPDWLARASWEDQKVFVAATRSQVEASPEWDPRHLPHREYEGGLHDHYGRAPYWDRDAPPGAGPS